MFSWFKKHVYHLLEIEKATPLPELTEDLKASLRTLQNHPGHQYIMSRLALERAALRERFERGFHASEAELRHYQAGIHWCSWLESELKRLTQVPRRTPVDLDAETLDMFSQVSADLEVVR